MDTAKALWPLHEYANKPCFGLDSIGEKNCTPRWNYFPFATDDFDHGVYKTELLKAFKKRYIQINPPKHQSWLIFDLDYFGAEFRWAELGLPEPNWIVINPKNGHAHYVYGLKTPVLLEGNNLKQHPIRYLNYVKKAYANLLSANENYAGLLTKNPFHRDWRVIEGSDVFYNLSDLAKYIKNTPIKTRISSKSEDTSESRNVDLFNDLRHWAYENINKHKNENIPNVQSKESWRKKCIDIAMNLNMKFPDQLAFNEVEQVAKSVSKWTYDKFSSRKSDAEFKKIQACRGKIGGLKSGLVRLKNCENKRKEIDALIALGYKKKDIAEKLDIHPNTVTRLLKMTFTVIEADVKQESIKVTDKKSPQSLNQIITRDTLSEQPPVVVMIGGYEFESRGGYLYYEGKPLGCLKWGSPALVAACGEKFQSIESWEGWFKGLKLDNSNTS